MTMSHPSDSAVAQLNALAHEVRETFSERGHHVATALDVDPAFRDDNNPRSALVRSLVKDAIRRGADQLGLGLEAGSGGTCIIQTFDGNTLRRLRLRSAKRRGETFHIETNSRAILELDGDTFYREESWVLGYVIAGEAEDAVGTIFAAEVLDVVDGTPGYLVLGESIILSTPPATAPGFVPADEDLDIDEDERGEEGAG